MIITLEGASAVGKTSTSQALASRVGAHVVSEVNAIFERPPDACASWYLERQVDRWRLATLHEQDSSLVVLDGDVFQPFWYNWTFPSQGFQALDSLVDFYRPLIKSGELKFPDRYVLLTASEAELRRRKESDSTRSRRNFETHLRLVSSQGAYFGMLESVSPGMVQVVEAEKIESTVALVPHDLKGIHRNPDTLKLFDEIVAWLQWNSAA